MSEFFPPYSKAHLNGDALILTPLVSELRDSGLCYEMRDEMINATQDTPHKRVVIDMRNVDFVSSIGVLVFLNLRRAAPPQEAKIVFCNLTDNLKGMFQICKLISETDEPATPFEAVDTLESALAGTT